VTAKECRHAVVGGAFAYKFQCGELSIGYSGDTTPSVEVLQFLEDCNMIIHEAGGAPISGHTPVEFIVSRTSSYVARKLYLTHYPDTLSNDEDKLHCNLLRAGHCYVVRRQGVCQEQSLTDIGKRLLEIRDKI
jgi:ribonuclease BN (tRNA processing enzyme)